MKFTSVAVVALLGAANAFTTSPPIEDSFVWVAEDDGMAKMHV